MRKPQPQTSRFFASPQAIHVRAGTSVAAWLLVALLSTGCAGIVDTPQYLQPEMPEKSQWSIAAEASDPIEPDWWRRFNDPYLDELSARAIANNATLELMALRSNEAGVQIGQAKAALLPVINAGTRTDTTTIAGEYDLGTATKYGTGADLSWELDIWGKARKGVEAQKAAYRASQADYRAGYLTLVSSVANTYFLIRQTDAEIAYLYNTLARGRELIRIYSALHERGLQDKAAVVSQEAEVKKIEITLKNLETNRAKLVNGLASLTGVPAGELEVPDTADFQSIESVTVPAGLPSDLLKRRPDILAAEQRLQQRVALEGQARLARLPSIGLTGLGGSASYGLSSLTNTSTLGLSSVVQFPVFDPNIRARIPVAKAQVEVAEQEYRVTVMNAFQEVEDALVTLEGSRSVQTLYEEIRIDRAYVAKKELERLRRGLASRLEVLVAERSLEVAQTELIKNRWQIHADTVSLYKAIGGGWTAEEPGS